MPEEVHVAPADRLARRVNEKTRTLRHRHAVAGAAERGSRTIAAATSSAMSRVAISPTFSSADTPSAIITAQYGQAVAIVAGVLRQRLLDAHDVDARADRLLQPHPPAARAAAHRLLPVEIEFERLVTGKPAQDGARRLEFAVVPPEVARLMIDDALELRLQPEPPLLDQPRDQLGVMQHFVPASEFGILVPERVERVGIAW